MKRISVLYWVAATAASLMLAGCGGGTAGGRDTGQWALGQWTLQSVSHSVDGPRHPAAAYGISARITIAGDGTWTGSGFHPETGEETVLEGTWSYPGNYTWLIETPEISVPLFRYRNELFFAVVDLREDRELIGWLGRTG